MNMWRIKRPQTLKLLQAIALLCIASVCSAENFSGKVIGVTDGDTITVIDQQDQTIQKIRLAGIDAPERNQAFGQRSKQSLSELVFGKIVKVETNKKDRYGRHVGKILLDGQDICLEQIRRGMAMFYRQYQRELVLADRERYEQVEEEAKETRRGLWVEASATPPWEFRRSSSTPSQSN